MRIILEHVDYTYQPGSISEAAALRDISLQIAPGEMLAVIGHGGSGKSTLALLLAGLYQPTSGKLTICEDHRHDPMLFRQVGMVFQYPEQQMFGESVFEEVAFGARNMGTPNDYLPNKVRQALDLVGLDADVFWHRSPFMLSGGQKRRVCLASVLVVNPRIVILDEPTAGLDAGGRRWLADLMRRLHEKGKTVIWVTHDMTEAAELAERIIVLDRGRAVLDGSPADVFAEEEILAQAHLRIPTAAALVRGLRQRGLPLPGTAVTVQQAYAEISGWLQQREQGPPADAAAQVGVALPVADCAGRETGTPDADLPAAQNNRCAAAALFKDRQELQQAAAGDQQLEAEPAGDEDEDAAWERETAQALQAIVKSATAEEAPAYQTAQPPQPEVDLDLTGLTGEETPRVPEWRGGADDV